MLINVMKYLYLVLTAAGLLLPIYFVGPVLLQSECLFASGCVPSPDVTAAGWHTVTAEALVIYCAWIVWMLSEARKRDVRRWWIYPLLTVISPFSFVFCLFLYVQSRGEAKAAG